MEKEGLEKESKTERESGEEFKPVDESPDESPDESEVDGEKFESSTVAKYCNLRKEPGPMDFL